MRHKNRTSSGDKKRLKHQHHYEELLIGKFANLEGEFINNWPVVGVIEEVTYIGNSTYGIVRLILDNGVEKLVSGDRGRFRPSKEDFHFVNFSK